MRLLRVEPNGKFSLVSYTGSKFPAYAILSHTWGPDKEEVTFKDLTERSGKHKPGYQKLIFCAKQTIVDGLEFFWVDTCCIDKSSSAELSEAINSMFDWYKDAKKCYVYLSDVVREHSTDWRQEFSESKWFTRGWTLQELLAPTNVVFYDRYWKALGTKSEYAHWISQISGIDKEILAEGESDITKRLDFYSVAKRMSWASKRKTTRTEDLAYCLLGLFNVNMPLLYGERERAFLRFQEEIMKNHCDDSILAWGLDSTRRPLLPDVQTSHIDSPILASSPNDFKHCGNLVRATKPDSSFNMTNLGLEIQIPMVPIRSNPSGSTLDAPGEGTLWLGLLNCSPTAKTELVGITLYSSDTSDANMKQHAVRVPIVHEMLPYHTVIVGPRLAFQSVLRKVIILQRGEETRRSSVYFQGGRQIMVNQSPRFKRTGYEISYGRGLDLAEERNRFGYTAFWDPDNHVLVIEDKQTSKDMIQFAFTAEHKSTSRDIDMSEPGSRWHWPWLSQAFTVFLRTDSKRITVQKETSFSEDDLRTIYSSLNGPLQHGLANGMADEPLHLDLNELILRDSESQPFQVKVQFKETAVYGWLMFEVDIDAQPVTGVQEVD